MAADISFIRRLHPDALEPILRLLDMDDLSSLSRTGPAAHRLVDWFSKRYIRPRLEEFLYGSAPLTIPERDVLALLSKVTIKAMNSKTINTTK